MKCLYHNNLGFQIATHEEGDTMKMRWTIYVAAALITVIGLTAAAAGAGERLDKKVERLEARISLLEAVVQVRDRRIAELEVEIGQLRGEADASENSEALTLTETLEAENATTGTDDLEEDAAGQEGVEQPEPEDPSDNDPAAAKSLGLSDINALVKNAIAQPYERQITVLATAAGNAFRLTATVVVAGGEPPYVVELYYESSRKIVERGPSRRGTGINAMYVYPGPIISSTPKQRIHIRAGVTVRPDCSPNTKMVVTGTITSVTINRTEGTGKTFCYEITIEASDCQVAEK